MKIKKLLIVSVLAVALLGCGKHEPQHIVILPDVSGSIDRESLEQAFKAIDELAGHLDRGDNIAIIPILGDAQAEGSGRILRFEVPTSRQAYDADMQVLRRNLATALTAMQRNATTHPGSKTDILGSVGLAEQEFRLDRNQSKRLLIILSDFLQEDTEINFKKDMRLRAPASAASFSQQVATNSALDLRGINIYLGLLRGDEYPRLERGRRAAVKAFWLTYFKSLGGVPEFSIDGPGLLRRFTTK
jgi:hypothetical protein